MEHYLIPSLQDLKQQRLAFRGLQDGWKGSPAGSEAQVYWSCYRRGELFRRAAAREIALTFGRACQCQRCGTMYEGIAGGWCICEGPPAPLVPGMAIAHGPAELDEEPDFLSNDALRRLCAQGTQVLTMYGERMNEYILSQ